MKFHRCLISVFLSALVLTGCNFKEILWTDYSENLNHNKIVLTFAKDSFSRSKKIKLIPHKTTKINVPENILCVGSSHDSNIKMYYYPKSFEKSNIKMEIFLFDSQNVDEKKDRFIVDPKKGVLAYFIDYYDEKMNKNYTIISKDNVLDKVTIETKNKKTVEEIIQRVSLSDYAYYTNINSEYEKHSVPYNGYIVKSKVDDSYIWLSTSFW